MGLREELPAAYVERMRKLLGEELEAYLEALELPRRTSLRLNPLRSLREEEIRPFLQERVPWAAQGYYCAEETRPGKSALHEAGAYYMQEASAMVPAALAAVQPGEHVLDLCAAPGGKTTQLAADLRGQGLLVSNEIHPERAKILSRNIERLGIRNAVVTNETPERLAERFPYAFDCVAVDAPCAGEGMFRKEPQALTNWSVDNVRMCAERQAQILESAARMTAPGGRIVYSTCTFSPEENEENMLAFLQRHPEFSLRDVRRQPGIRAEEWGFSEGRKRTEDGSYVPDPDGPAGRMVRIWPHRTGGEGHFAAVLEREGSRLPAAAAAAADAPEAHEGKKMKEKQRKLRGAKGRRAAESGGGMREVTEAWEAFAAEALRKVPEGVPVLFGETLYLLPVQMQTEGLRILRAGLELGNCRKGRFVPAHALAMALQPEEAVNVLRIAADSAASAAWLRGESLPAEGTGRGWTLVCAGNCPLGWGRSDGRIVKNHYPKGLRR